MRGLGSAANVAENAIYILLFLARHMRCYAMLLAHRATPGTQQLSHSAPRVVCCRAHGIILEYSTMVPIYWPRACLCS